MDAITLLKDDHKTVEKLFKRFEKAGERAYAEKREIADRICEELSKHAAIEEMIFYPVTRETVPETDDIVLESLEEHHIVKWVLSEIEKMDPTDERFDAKMTVLIEMVRHHVEEEEGEYFPKVREELGRKALNELGDAMVEAKATAPTHPHPRAPDTPPGNVVAGAAAGMADKVGDTMSGLAQGSLSAAQDLIARVTGSKSSARSADGSSAKRSAARTVRKGAANASERAGDATAKAKRTGRTAAKTTASRAKATAKAASSGAKGTATSAKRGAKKTAATASRGAKATGTSAKRAARTTKTTAKRGATTTARKAQASA
ncbi:MAG: hemerythrin [Acidimicrobiales bacterium]|nr:hemerythrin [Acidimicrobiales bacterium]